MQLYMLNLNDLGEGPEKIEELHSLPMDISMMTSNTYSGVSISFLQNDVFLNEPASHASIHFYSYTVLD